MSIKRDWNNEPAIQQKFYSQEEYIKKKKKSYQISKFTCYMSQMMVIFGWNITVSLVLFILMMSGTSALPYIAEITVNYGKETFWCRGGIFIDICMGFLILFAVTGLFYAIGYKIVEIMCIHLDGGLKGAYEVNEAAMRANFRGQLARSVGGVYADTEALSGPERILAEYLTHGGVRMMNFCVFGWIKRGLVVAQVILAGICLYCLLR